jgi:hypothetical protein
MTDTAATATASDSVVRRSKPPATSTIRDREPAPWRCDVAVQAVVIGNQDIKVLAVSACASGNGVPHLAVRVGRILIYVEDREALNAFVDAWNRADAVADRAFGPLFPSKQSEAAARIRRDGGVTTY